MSVGVSTLNSQQRFNSTQRGDKNVWSIATEETSTNNLPSVISKRGAGEEEGECWRRGKSIKMETEDSSRRWSGISLMQSRFLIANSPDVSNTVPLHQWFYPQGHCLVWYEDRCHLKIDNLKIPDFRVSPPVKLPFITSTEVQQPPTMAKATKTTEIRRKSKRRLVCYRQSDNYDKDDDMGWLDVSSPTVAPADCQDSTPVRCLAFLCICFVFVLFCIFLFCFVLASPKRMNFRKSSLRP